VLLVCADERKLTGSGHSMSVWGSTGVACSERDGPKVI